MNEPSQKKTFEDAIKHVMKVTGKSRESAKEWLRNELGGYFTWGELESALKRWKRKVKGRPLIVTPSIDAPNEPEDEPEPEF